MAERRGDEPVATDRLGAVAAASGVHGMVLEVAQGRVNGVRMGRFDSGRDVGGGEGVQQRDGLVGLEREIEGHHGAVGRVQQRRRGARVDTCEHGTQHVGIDLAGEAQQRRRGGDPLPRCGDADVVVLDAGAHVEVVLLGAGGELADAEHHQLRCAATGPVARARTRSSATVGSNHCAGQQHVAADGAHRRCKSVNLDRTGRREIAVGAEPDRTASFVPSASRRSGPTGSTRASTIATLPRRVGRDLWPVGPS
jgi:hypothetical protein